MQERVWKDDAAVTANGNRNRQGYQFLLLVAQGTIRAGRLHQIAERLHGCAAVLVQVARLGAVLPLSRKEILCSSLFS